MKSSKHPEVFDCTTHKIIPSYRRFEHVYGQQKLYNYPSMFIFLEFMSNITSDIFTQD